MVKISYTKSAGKNDEILLDQNRELLQTKP